ncbi:FHA domain-containing protein [Dendrosporobacter sp. 1207_IL3150]|uniref:FHA domain-containing protein n=1 Tax=Dendrosporobacter sp. 1207_IL3150 TaxID=3084054 RepID=UPI002FDA1144
MKTIVPTVLSIILQYSLVILIYYFLFRIIKIVYLDLHKTDIQTTTNNHHPGNVATGIETAKLVVIESLNPKLRNSVFPLGDAISIGRNYNNDIVIEDNFVSYDHACITKYKHDYWLTDLKSTNNTYVNGKLVDDEVALSKGDTIKIGAVTFRFER